MKNKNPLYVVKGQNVEQAKNIFDMFIKKLDLEPVMRIFNQLLDFLLSQVKSYPMFAVVKSMIDQWMLQLVPLLQQVSGMFAKA